MGDFNKELKEAENCFNSGAYKEAYQRYLVLAEEGHSDSQVFVGWMTLNGLGVESSPERASHWFQRSASLGSARGAFYYGRFLTSQGMHEDALGWYRVAAKKNDTPATFRLGYSLVRGKGAPVNLDEGYRCLIFAAKNGHVFALREIAIRDIKGGRGLPGRLAGLFSLLFSIFLGICIALRDRYSERLLA